MACLPCCGKTKEGKQVVGLAKKRHCTDLLFLLLFWFSWGIIIILVSSARDEGADPDKIIRGVDLQGNICGVTAGFEDKPFAAWPDPTVSYQAKICVDSCEHTNNQNSTDMHYLYESIEFTYYCIPDITAPTEINGSLSLDGFEDSKEIASRAIGDLYTSWVVLLCSPLIALVITFFFTFVNKRCAGVLVWGCLTLMLVGTFIAGYVLFKYGRDADSSVDPDRAKAAQVAGGVLVAIALIFTLIIFFLRKRIKIAIEVVKESAKLVIDMPSILIFPLFPMLFMIGYFAFWIFTTLYMWSVSTATNIAIPPSVKTLYGPQFDSCNAASCPNDWAGLDTMVNYETEEKWKQATAYNFFHMLWNVQFIYYFCYLTFAGAAAAWYFTPYEGKSKPRGRGDGKLTRWPICASVGRTLRYHMGTVALCSLIIAIIQFIRAVVMYIEKRTRGKNGTRNRVQKAVFCCIQCCLKCLECCMDKVNKNALIWTAIWGDGFCTAACSSFMLIWRNLARVAAITVVSHLVLAFTKLVIAITSMGVVGLIVTQNDYYDRNVSSPVAPCIVAFIISWVVASLFMAVFNSVIDTIFICFLVDEEHNKGGNMLASASLQKLVGDYSAQSAKKAKEAQELREARQADGVTTNEVTIEG